MPQTRRPARMARRATDGAAVTGDAQPTHQDQQQHRHATWQQQDPHPQSSLNPRTGTRNFPPPPELI
jgi:hypothetical protein